MGKTDGGRKTTEKKRIKKKSSPRVRQRRLESWDYEKEKTRQWFRPSWRLCPEARLSQSDTWEAAVKYFFSFLLYFFQYPFPSCSSFFYRRRRPRSGPLESCKRLRPSFLFFSPRIFFSSYTNLFIPLCHSSSGWISKARESIFAQWGRRALLVRVSSLACRGAWIQRPDFNTSFPFVCTYQKPKRVKPKWERSWGKERKEIREKLFCAVFLLIYVGIIIGEINMAESLLYAIWVYYMGGTSNE